MSGKPVLRIFLPFVCGIILSRYVACPILPVAIFFIFLTIIDLFLFRSKFHRLFGIITFAAMVCMGFLRTGMSDQWIPGNDIRHLSGYEQDVCLQGVIKTPVQNRQEKQVFHLDCDSVWVAEKGYECSGLTRVVVRDSCTLLRQGDLIFIKGRIRQPPAGRNPGDFDFRAYLAARHVHTQTTIKGATNLLLLASDHDGFFTRSLIRPAREYVDALIRTVLQGQERALLRGLLIGLRDEIDDELRAEFACVGVVHVLAVSGLHVGFILLAAVFFLQLLRVKHSWRLPLLLLILLFYCRLTGSAPPVMRASIMAAVILAAPFVQRRHDAINNIALAAFLILMLQPLDLFTTGFQLSFAAVAGIVLLYGRLEDLFSQQLERWREQGAHTRRRILQLFLVSLSAQIVTIPLVVYYFNRLPLYALIANLLVVPLVSLIVFIGLVGVLAGVIYLPVGIIYMHGNWALLRGLLFIVKNFAALPYASVMLATPNPAQIALYYLFLFTIAYWSQTQIARRLIFISLIAASGYAWYHAWAVQPLLRVTFFDVGQGDAALCEFPDGRTLLIDTGDASEYMDYGERVIIPYLQRHGIHRLEAMLLTHAHADHIGGAVAILRQIKVGRIIQSACSTDRKAYHSIDSLVAVHASPVQYVSAGDTLSGFAGSSLYVLAPGRGQMEQVDENECSIIISLQYGQHTFLFTGDAGGDLEERLDHLKPFLRADVVKVPHHGSLFSQTPYLAEQCGCRYAVISVGRYNLFGLPSETAIAWWQSTGARVFRTDEDGAIVFTTDGFELTVNQ
ncbi:DNA internalization-related competence protein ComEC/Rec2 [candidate division KSB1 bacterium]|nr:DNA internalization-related competence protein ComEC/Rec2 [candidate division KSB1 bacterium]